MDDEEKDLVDDRDDIILEDEVPARTERPFLPPLPVFPPTAGPSGA